MVPLPWTKNPKCRDMANPTVRPPESMPHRPPSARPSAVSQASLAFARCGHDVVFTCAPRHAPHVPCAYQSARHMSVPVAVIDAAEGLVRSAGHTAPLGRAPALIRAARRRVKQQQWLHGTSEGRVWADVRLPGLWQGGARDARGRRADHCVP